MHNPPSEETLVAAAEGDDRRRKPRAQVHLEVGLRFASVQQFLSAYAEDISESGMFIRSEHAQGELGQLGQLVTLRFDAGNERIVQGTGRVMRVVPAGEHGTIPGVGVEFVELDAQGRKLVEAIVRIKLASTAF